MFGWEWHIAALWFVCCPEKLSICSNISLIVDNQNRWKKAIWIIIEKAAGRRVSWISKQVGNYTPGTQEQKCGWSRAEWRRITTVVLDESAYSFYFLVLNPLAEECGPQTWSCFKLYYISLPTELICVWILFPSHCRLPFAWFQLFGTRGCSNDPNSFSEEWI